jgi:hypothetical protein
MMKNDELQQTIKDQLSDIDEIVIGEDGKEIIQYMLMEPGKKFPCASLSLALACAKGSLLAGIPVQILPYAVYLNMINAEATGEK